MLQTHEGTLTSPCLKLMLLQFIDLHLEKRREADVGMRRKTNRGLPMQKLWRVDFYHRGLIVSL